MRRRAAGLLVVLTLLSGCAVLPESGPVRRTSSTEGSDVADNGTFSAPGPGQGDAPVQIVNGFITAMTSNPAGTGTARTFLSRAAREQWNPSTSTVIYEATTVTPGPGSTVLARLSDPRLLDARGGWRGPAGSSYSRLRLHVVKEDGEWRIADPPDALLIPDYFLQQEYQPYELYFFDASQRVLVPDRVYLPRGEQTPSLLVRALLDGPGAVLAPITRTAFPALTQLDLSVPVSPDGVAEVPLSKQMLRVAPDVLDRAAAQLAWTLRQVPGVNRIRLTVDGNPLALPDGRRDFGVDAGAAYAPWVRGADPTLFALRVGRLVRVGEQGATTTTGPFGRAGFAVRTIAVNLAGSQAAAISANGRDVYVGTVEAAKRAGTSDKAPAPQRVYRGTDLLSPSYDMFGGIWLVDRTAKGARIVRVLKGTRSPVDIAGITGLAVRALVVSRDGSRIAAIVDRGKKGDALRTAEVLRSGDGSLARVTRARTVTSLPSDFRDLVDLAWRSPDDVAVLARSGAKISDVSYVSLDGSPGDPSAVGADSWPGAARALVGSPDPAQTLYLVTSAGGLVRLDAGGRWRPTELTKRLTSVGYVG